MGKEIIVLDQKFRPAFIEWLDKRCPGFKSVEGTVYTIAYVEEPEDGIAREENVLTVCAISRFTAHTCEATLATNGAKRSKANAEYIWTIFNYIFNTVNKSRFYTYVNTKNLRSIAVQQLLGMEQLILITDHFGPGEDALLFGLTKEQWMKGPWASKDK